MDGNRRLNYASGGGRGRCGSRLPSENDDMSVCQAHEDATREITFEVHQKTKIRSSSVAIQQIAYKVRSSKRTQVNTLGAI